MSLPKHFEIFKDGNSLLFDVAKCERCGREVKGVNAIGGIASDAPKYRELGMTERVAPEGEYCWSDELGEAVCESCYEWAIRRPKDLKAAFLSFLEREGIEGLIKLLEEVKASNAYDPVLEWLCEQADAQSRKEVVSAQ